MANAMKNEKQGFTCKILTR